MSHMNEMNEGAEASRITASVTCRSQLLEAVHQASGRQNVAHSITNHSNMTTAAVCRGVRLGVIPREVTGTIIEPASSAAIMVVTIDHRHGAVAWRGHGGTYMDHSSWKGRDCVSGSRIHTSAGTWGRIMALWGRAMHGARGTKPQGALTDDSRMTNESIIINNSRTVAIMSGDDMRRNGHGTATDNDKRYTRPGTVAG